MTTITLEMEDEKAEQLRERARQYGLDLERFVLASIDDLMAQPDEEFKRAMDRVLEKNRELYRRLA